MVAMTNTNENCIFEVVHPMDDVQEVKRTGEGLGLMPMSPGVRFCLLALRGYLLLMMLLVLYHMLDLAGLFAHYPIR
jgi:hypothetical protein